MEQSSFIPRRQAANNVILAQEIMHRMRHKQEKKGWMASKFDLEKVYDRVNWNFFEQVLRAMGFAPHLVSLIMRCSSQVSLSILWNGEKLESFSPTRGIWKGDPLRRIFLYYVWKL